jgi:hypothetical protein
MKKLLIIGGDRLGNYETMAPIVQYFKFKQKFKILTIFQSKEVVSKLSKNKLLSALYRTEKIIIFSKFSSIFQMISVISYILFCKRGFVLTNRVLISPKFKLLRILLRKKGWLVLYTKSFSRSPAKNIRALMSSKSASLCKNELADFCLIPTHEHMIDYAVSGYRVKHMLVTGYPKLWKSWAEFIAINDSNNKKYDYLITMGIYYQNYDKVLSEILYAIRQVNSKACVSIKPHPTTNLNFIRKMINNESNNGLEISISENNVAMQSLHSKVTISHGTSACIDASIGSVVIGYWGSEKHVVDKYLSKKYDDRESFELFESNSACKEFILSECYNAKDLEGELKYYFSNKLDRNVIDSNEECDLILEINKLISKNL